jgi:signal transduction histidine kinase
VVTVTLAGMVILFCLYTILQAARAAPRREGAVARGERACHASVRLSELTALFQVSTTLQLQLRSDVILEIIVRRVVSTLKAQQASIMILEPENGELVTRASYGTGSRVLARCAQEGRRGHRRLGRVAPRGGDARSSARRTPELGRHYKENRRITSALSLPLGIGERRDRRAQREPHQSLRAVRRSPSSRCCACSPSTSPRSSTVPRCWSAWAGRARELEADNVKLSDLNRMKDVFLGTASHELKTPLTSVIAYAELLDDHEGKLSRDQGREFVGRLRAEAQRLLGLIEDILDLSRLESGKFALKPRQLDISEVVRGAIETTRPMAQKYGVVVKSELQADLPALTVDEVKIRQVLVNLIVNAIKFSPRDTPVQLSARVDGTYVRVEVTDRGPGIAPDSTTHIFELFGQNVSEDADARGGLGIGLHLVKRITELHGGHVGVNSRPGEGSTFWIRLPLAPEMVATGTAREDRAAA